MQIATDNNFTTAQLNWAEDSIVRPNAFDRIPDPYDFFLWIKTGYGLKEIEQEWMHMASEDKIQFLSKYGIKEMDYRTVSFGAKI